MVYTTQLYFETEEQINRIMPLVYELISKELNNIPVEIPTESEV